MCSSVTPPQEQTQRPLYRRRKDNDYGAHDRNDHAPRGHQSLHGFGVDIRYAIGASLVSVIATSSGAAAAYVKEGFTNIRIGMFLEIATTIGALGDAFLATKLPVAVIAIIFGLVLLYSAALSGRPQHEHADTGPADAWATCLQLHGAYPTPYGLQPYQVCAVPLGFSLMFGAGLLSGLLGIGSGAAKVLAMDHLHSAPFSGVLKQF